MFSGILCTSSAVIYLLVANTVLFSVNDVATYVHKLFPHVHIQHSYIIFNCSHI